MKLITILQNLSKLTGIYKLFQMLLESFHLSTWKGRELIEKNYPTKYKSVVVGM